VNGSPYTNLEEGGSLTTQYVFHGGNLAIKGGDPSIYPFFLRMVRGKQLINAGVKETSGSRRRSFF
jgi:hypothetical protein